MIAAVSLELVLEPVLDEGIRVRVGDDEDRAAVAAVAATRPAARHVLLTSERQTPPSAVAGFDVDVDFIDEQMQATRLAGC